MTKYNIRLDAYHITQGYIGGGLIFRDWLEKEIQALNALESIQSNGLRDNGIAVWDNGSLFYIGKEIAAQCTFNLHVVT